MNRLQLSLVMAHVEFGFVYVRAGVQDYLQLGAVDDYLNDLAYVILKLEEIPIIVLELIEEVLRRIYQPRQTLIEIIELFFQVLELRQIEL